MSRKIYHRLTVPVTYRYPQRIDEVGIDNTADWARRHLQALATNYRRAPFFESCFPAIEALLRRRWERISELNLSLIECVRGMLGIADRPAVRASALSAAAEPTQRLIDICRELGADTYLAGAGAAAYMDAARFAQSGVRLRVQAFEHPVYPQRYEGFTPQLSIVDLIFNCGPESAAVIRAGSRPA